ncbi:MAG TPA: helix-turn-helix transcriptional regulator [Candidatus Deferrimicrobium sp.]|nr:helix-turn-helix transcriptional regulator [Candidatus Kapabacteria bacterium]HLP59871.1 helix-turn-helix transcriptional regulator [Candidatus Deferrimicrobium sp.]
MDSSLQNRRNIGKVVAFQVIKKRTISDQVVEFVLKCKNEELGKLSVSEVARTFKVSESFLSRKFRTDKSFTLGKFIFRERMFRSAELLVGNRELTIKSLADIMGFSDYDYFIRTFKKYYGVSPSRYRYCKN